MAFSTSLVPGGNFLFEDKGDKIGIFAHIDIALSSGYLKFAVIKFLPGFVFGTVDVADIMARRGGKAKVAHDTGKGRFRLKLGGNKEEFRESEYQYLLIV